jgi:hypothetical protein
MPPNGTLHSLRRAFTVFDGRPPAVREEAPFTLTRDGPLSAAALEEATCDLHWRLPDDYEDLLLSVGPFRIVAEPPGIERTDFFAPGEAARVAAHRLLELLRLQLESFPEDPPPHYRKLTSSAADDLLVVATTYDSNGRYAYLFYGRDQTALYEVHEKDLLEEREPDDLEAMLARWVGNCAQWDERRADYYTMADFD